jgi:hypothetical protein
MRKSPRRLKVGIIHQTGMKSSRQLDGVHRLPEAAVMLKSTLKKIGIVNKKLWTKMKCLMREQPLRKEMLMGIKKPLGKETCMKEENLRMESGLYGIHKPVQYATICIGNDQVQVSGTKNSAGVSFALPQMLDVGSAQFYNEEFGRFCKLSWIYLDPCIWTWDITPSYDRGR